MSDTRKCEILIAGYGAVEVGMSTLCQGEIFRLFETTGEPIVGNEGSTTFIAGSDAYRNAEDVVEVAAEEV